MAFKATEAPLLTTIAIDFFHHTYTANDAAMLVAPAMGSSATTERRAPLVLRAALESGFQNDARNPGQRALARIVETELEEAGDTAAEPGGSVHRASHPAEADDSVSMIAEFIGGLENLNDRPSGDAAVPAGAGTKGRTSMDASETDAYASRFLAGLFRQF